MSEDIKKSYIIYFPRYSHVCKLLRILKGISKTRVKNMAESILEQTGTPQNPVDWSDPDKWIVDRLSGDNLDLAQRIWKESCHEINPRHIADIFFFINKIELFYIDDTDIYRLTKRGNGFLSNDDEIVKEIDSAEALDIVLKILAPRVRAVRKEILPEWTDFIREQSNISADSTIKDSLRYRLLNLLDRGLLSREGNKYIITQEGISYADSFAGIPDDPKREVMKAINSFNDRQRESLRERLGNMNPYHFEHLVCDLLEAMGYEDTTVTKESGDRGVDVVAKIQIGITTVTEVVQVKRHRGSIGRPILDQLRGVLVFHGAIRGTLINLGSFSKECKKTALYPGAAPITLIDGNKLLDLMIEYEIGIKKRNEPLYDLDEDYFKESFERDQIKEVLE